MENTLSKIWNFIQLLALLFCFVAFFYAYDNDNVKDLILWGVLLLINFMSCSQTYLKNELE